MLILRSMAFMSISFLAVSLVFSWSSISLVFGKPKETPVTGVTCGELPTRQGDTICCQTFTDNQGLEIKYCTICDDTQPPSNCTPRYIEDTRELPKLPPPVVTTQPPSVAPPPKGSPPIITGTINQSPSSNAPTQFSSTPTGNNNTTTNNSGGSLSMKALRGGGGGIFSPTGGCVPGGTTCIPCDIGLARIGANCVPSGDWHPGGSGLGTELGGSGGSSTPPTVQPPPAQGAVTEQPSTNVAPAKLCPNGLPPDINGNCPTTPTTNTNQQSGSTSNNNNNPQQGHHHKGSNNQPTQTAGGGGQELTATKKHKESKTVQGTTTQTSS